MGRGTAIEAAGRLQLGGSMPELTSLGSVTFYSIAWAGVARLAVEIFRINQRGRRARASREIAMRLWRWRDC